MHRVYLSFLYKFFVPYEISDDLLVKFQNFEDHEVLDQLNDINKLKISVDEYSDLLVSLNYIRIEYLSRIIVNFSFLILFNFLFSRLNLYIFIPSIIYFFTIVVRYLLQIELRIIQIRALLSKKKIQLQDSFLYTNQGRLEGLRIYFKMLEDKSNNLFFRDDDRNKLVYRYLRRASNILFNSFDSQLKDPSLKDPLVKDQLLKDELSKDIYKASAYLDAVARFIKNQEDDDRFEVISEHLNRFVIVFYTISLIVIMIVSYIKGVNSDIEIPFFSVPLWTIISGALGSIAALLYRYYKKIETKNFRKELRWTLARPFLGIVLSVIVYLFLKASLLAFGSSTNEGSNSILSRDIALIFCFVVSFSDQALEEILNKLVGFVNDSSTLSNKNSSTSSNKN